MSAHDDPAADDDGPVRPAGGASPNGPGSADPDPSAGPARRRVTAIVVAVGLLVALVVIGRPLVSAALDGREQVLSSNSAVVQSTSARALKPRRTTCQSLVYLPSGSRLIRVFPAYAGRRAPKLTFDVRVGKRSVARATASRYPSEQPLSVPVSRLPTTDAAELCIENGGPGTVEIADARGQFANESRPPIRVDVLSGRSPDTASMVPDALERAGRFKAGVVGAGTIAVLGLALLVGVGAFVVLVLRDRSEDAA